MKKFTSQNGSTYCTYYQANIKPDQAWLLVAILKSVDHVAFDRTIDVPSSLFEFFVPESMEQQFLFIMNIFKKRDVVSNLKKLSNRLLDPSERV